MDSIIRGALVYVIMLFIFRMAGKRTLASIDTFDLVLTLIISETLQQALINDDNSMTNALLLVLTLVGLDILLSLLKDRVPALGRVLDSTATVVVKGGKMQHESLKKERVDESDLLSSARLHHGISTLAEIDYAVVEKSGEISIVPKT
jgi:uncharacterized membrane protein YcaP (DUF421 family)